MHPAFHGAGLPGRSLRHFAAAARRLGRIFLRAVALGPLLAGAALSAADAPAAHASASPSAVVAPRILRVAADPNNLPFSNRGGEGFENRIVALLADELGASVEYTWLPERRGFFRRALKEGNCDVVAAGPVAFDRTLTTIPYYQSSYVFLSRADRHLELSGFDDPQLRKLQIGVQLIGDDSSNTPPAHALSHRGIIDNVHGYTVYGDYGSAAPLANIVDAVSGRAVDVAVVWGPVAGYFAKRRPGVFRLTPVLAPGDQVPYPCVFSICVGVRRNNPALRDELNRAIEKRRREINLILADYGIPLVEPKGT
jgi:quinoprotein dehydrogenase-associated probable ABC transporter substrate-binding protein